jgi:hypothetical protein
MTNSDYRPNHVTGYERTGLRQSQLLTAAKLQKC